MDQSNILSFGKELFSSDWQLLNTRNAYWARLYLHELLVPLLFFLQIPLSFSKKLWEKEKMLATSIFSFLLNVFYSFKDKSHNLFHVWFVICWNFEFGSPKIWSFPKDKPGFNPLGNVYFLDWIKFKAIADDKLIIAKIMIPYFDRVDNILGKGEYAGYQHFLLFPHCFQMTFFTGKKLGLSSEELITVMKEAFFENIVGKGGNVSKQHFSTVFYPIKDKFNVLSFICLLQLPRIWTRLKFCLLV